jgi:penicillin-insensitive murein endopeptidase
MVRGVRPWQVIVVAVAVGQGGCASSAPDAVEPGGVAPAAAETEGGAGDDGGPEQGGAPDAGGPAEGETAVGDGGAGDAASAAEVDEGFDDLDADVADELEDEGDGELDDGAEDSVDRESKTWQQLPPHPLAGVAQKQLVKMLQEDMAALGPMSFGRIHGGALLNGVQMPQGEGWTVRQPQNAWGTQETVDAVVGCIEKVRTAHPGTRPLTVGHLSRKRGGRFPPHVSHQNGRDIDLAYYYTGDEPWYTRATAENLDAARTWSLVRCFVTESDVELIIVDRALQKVLREHAAAIGEDAHWLDQLFGGRTATVRPMLRHASGHATHIHARFYSPVARETGRRLYEHLVRIKAIAPPTEVVFHRARKGDTVAAIAKRYGVGQREILKANKMRRTSLVKVGKLYRVPRRGGVKQDDLSYPFKVPPRRLPPQGEAVARPAGRGGGAPARGAP